MIRSRILSLCAAVLMLGAGCGKAPAESAQAPETGASVAPTLTWEEFRSKVYQEPDTGVYIANGDEMFSDEKELREFYDLYFSSEAQELGQARSELAVMYRRNARAQWGNKQRQSLTYCVSTGFGTRYATVVADMASAAGAWESVAPVDFIHLSAYDGNCTASTANVMFDVRPVSGQSYLARAFFPDDARSVRNVLIDGTAFSTTPPLTLTGILRHELGHTLGFRHEHTRPESGTCFEDNQWRALTSYDPYSVMHYPQCNGAGDWSLTLTSLDQSGANAMYSNTSPTCNGSSGQWSGCRGTGCSVCAEKVKDYPLYFKNHPLCDKNDICGGSYFTCNQNCPAPGSADRCDGTPGTWAGCRGNGCSVCAELVKDYPCYFKNNPACVQNEICGGLYFTCNQNCPAPTEADRCNY
jgi:hypothetical protein